MFRQNLKENFMIVEADDNLLIGLHLSNISALNSRINEHFPTRRAEEKAQQKRRRIVIFMFYDANAHNLCVEWK